ncbi:MAG: hypothetical protein JW751_09460 [Polyangiaceae bacterium]|nr:hypothetical protein [Polyangiaceae bacterium]
MAASGVTATATILNGSANPFGNATTGWFRYGRANPGTCNGTFGTRLPASGGTALGAGTATVSYSQTLTGLTANTTYYFCAIAQNGAGTAFGGVLSFTTPDAPNVVTDDASNASTTTATLNGSVTPNGDATAG